MMPCTARELCAAVGGTLLQDSGAPVTGVTTDSRAVQPGQLFIPLVGERFDGHAYIGKALDGGAAGCLTAREPEMLLPGKLYIQVADTRLALKALASWYRNKFDLPVVQVTGSAGKTTTKEMIASVLSQRYNTLRTEGNFNNDIGAPLTLLRLMPEHQAAVIETGMNHFGEIRYLGEMVRPDIAVITNVGDAHIENLGNTRQGILRAKCEIFENLTPEGVAVLNGDDELLNTVTLPQTILRCGVDDGCGVRVTDIDDRGLEGVACTVTIEGEHYRLTTSAPGRYMIYPMAMAAAIGRRLGLTGEEIAAGVAAYTTVGIQSVGLDAYIHQKEHAIDYFWKVIEMLPLDKRILAYRYAAEEMKKQGKMNESRKFLEEHIRLRDSTYYGRKEELLERMQNLREYKKQQERILQVEKNLSDKEVLSHRVVAFFAIIILASFLFYYRIKQNKNKLKIQLLRTEQERNQSDLKRKEAEIQYLKEKEEKETIALARLNQRLEYFKQLNEITIPILMQNRNKAGALHLQ